MKSLGAASTGLAMNEATGKRNTHAVIEAQSALRRIQGGTVTLNEKTKNHAEKVAQLGTVAAPSSPTQGVALLLVINRGLPGVALLALHRRQALRMMVKGIGRPNDDGRVHGLQAVTALRVKDAKTARPLGTGTAKGVTRRRRRINMKMRDVVS